MSKQELNRKLAEWAGTEGIDYTDPDFGIAHCFEWLVPKSTMDTLWIINNLDSPVPKIEYCFGFTRGISNGVICWSKQLPIDDCLSPIAETPALAICLAIEKLIPKEVFASPAGQIRRER